MALPGQDLAGRTALVTGGATGIGFAIATALAEVGMGVAIADLNAEAAEAAAAKLDGAVPVAIDVRDRASVETGFNAAERLGDRPARRQCRRLDHAARNRDHR